MPELDGPQTGPLTPNSAAAAYITGAQFVVIFDWRTAAELLSDVDAPLANTTAVQNSPILAELLQEAAGQIEMATSRGNRYQPADLTTLASGTTNMGSRLRRLNAAIAMEMLWRRRPDKEMPAMKEFEEAQDTLAALEAGEVVFGFQETMNAGMLQESRQTRHDVEHQHLPTTIARNLFGSRANTMRRHCW